MRKRIAVITNGWSSEFLQEVGQGIRLVASRANTDVFVFVNYSFSTEIKENTHGEFSIFELPDLCDFDGAIIMANTFNLKKELDYIHEEVLKAKIPAISLEYKLDGIDYFGANDYSGMCELVEHLMCDHGVKNVVYISGIQGHEGNKIRQKAVLDIAAKHGIVVPDENIINGSFAAAIAVSSLKEWMGEHNNVLPEAIICANDIMAIGVCDWLKEEGYTLPNDVIVTGFDCLRISQEYEPQITTVNREWFSMGTKCMEKLLNKMEGKEVSGSEEIQTSLVCGESCGCSQAEIYYGKKNNRKADTRKFIDGFACDQHFRHMFLYLRKAKNAEELNRSLSLFFENEGWLEGGDVLMAFNPDFFIDDEWYDENLDHFPDELDIVCNRRNKENKPMMRMNKKEAIFSFADNSETAGIYIYAPVKIDAMPLGFAVITKGFGIFQNDIMYLWCRHMSEYMELVKSNMRVNRLTKRLENLSVTDSLTGVYNRTGCESIIYPALSQNQKKNGRSIVMLADLDGLKGINDKYGHRSGDKAITMSVEAMKNAIPEGFMIGRYGGDEFLIAGCVKNGMQLEKIADDISRELHKIAIENSAEYNLSISVGGIQLERGEKFDVAECIQKADTKMYQIKDIHHHMVMNE